MLWTWEAEFITTKDSTWDLFHNHCSDLMKTFDSSEILVHVSHSEGQCHRSLDIVNVISITLQLCFTYTFLQTGIRLGYCRLHKVELINPHWPLDKFCDNCLHRLVLFAQERERGNMGF
jgi:hypothetical protein